MSELLYTKTSQKYDSLFITSNRFHYLYTNGVVDHICLLHMSNLPNPLPLNHHTIHEFLCGL